MTVYQAGSTGGVDATLEKVVELINAYRFYPKKRYGSHASAWPATDDEEP